MITLSELHTMIARASAPQAKGARVLRVLLNFHLRDFGQAAAFQAGQIRAHLEPRGRKARAFISPSSHRKIQNKIMIDIAIENYTTGRYLSLVPTLLPDNARALFPSPLPLSRRAREALWRSRGSIDEGLYILRPC
jgi:hypothetical protein